MFGEPVTTIQLLQAVGLMLLPYLTIIPFEVVGLLVGLRASGARLRWVVLPPFALQRHAGRWRLRFGPRWYAFAGHYALLNPTPAMLRRVLPLTTIGTAFGGTVGFLIEMNQARTLLPFNLLVSVLMASAIPLAMLLDNARGTLRALWGGGSGDAERQLFAVHMLAAASAAGTRPRDWNPEQIATAATDVPNAPEIVTGYLLAHEHALDSGDIPDARRWLQRALAAKRVRHGVTGMRVHLAAAYFEAFHERDARLARGHTRQVWRLTLESHTRLRVEAAVLLAEGRVERARRAANRALEKLSPSLDPGIAQVDDVLLQAMLFELDQTASTPASASRGAG
jgi:hypothetical protein